MALVPTPDSVQQPGAIARAYLQQMYVPPQPAQPMEPELAKLVANVHAERATMQLLTAPQHERSYGNAACMLQCYLAKLMAYCFERGIDYRQYL